MSRVYPSAGDLATSSMPMLPPAPVRGSTTKVCPIASDNLGASHRDMRLEPPVPNGITMRTVLAGYVAGCACAGAQAIAVATAHSSPKNRIIIRLGVVRDVWGLPQGF